MSVFTTHHSSATRPARWADLTGRTLMAITGISTLIPFVNGISRVAGAPEAYMLTEWWRTTAYLVFAGLWGLLAWTPRRQPGIWELLLIQKTAVSVFALANLGCDRLRTRQHQRQQSRGGNGDRVRAVPRLAGLASR